MENVTERCPVSGIAEDFRPYEQDGMNELYARARREEPVFYSPEVDCWVVTRRDDAVAIFSDPDTYSASNSQSPIEPFPESVEQYLLAGGYRREPTQANCDRPKHTRIRKAASRYLKAKRYRELEPEIRSLVKEYIGAMKGKEQVDLVDEMCYEFPARVIFLLLGAPDVDARQIKHWSDNRFQMLFGKVAPETAAGSGEQLLDYWNYCCALVEDRQKNPRDDYASALLEIRDGDDEVLTLNEINSLVFGILLAGHETTSNGLASFIYELLRNDGDWARIRDGEVSLEAAVEESLRYTPPFVTWRRRCTKDVEIAGVSIPKGSAIMMSLSSANRDESYFDDGENFVAGRENADPHLSFGRGIHFCLGAALARIEMAVAVEELTKAFPNMTLQADQKVEWSKTISPRGPSQVLVNLNGDVSAAAAAAR